MNMTCEKQTPEHPAVMQGFGADGFLAEYAAVDYRGAIILPEKMDSKTAAPFFCAGVTSFNAVDACECEPGEWIAIVGCGGLGQLGIQYAKAMGLKVVALDINDKMLDSAKETGADLVYNTMTNKDYIDELKAATGGGAAAVAVFSAAQAAYDNAPKTLRINGVYMAVGIPPGLLKISAMEVVSGLYRLKGVNSGPPKKLPKAIEFTATHDIKTRVSFHRLEEINEMIDRMKAGDVSKRMVVLFD
jgi:D-arabinose 1-dehydrogenase-like Zn-dependent alcohol dehydrogenase